MLRFQHLNLDGDVMSHRYRRALRSSREALIRELDVQEVLGDLAGDAKLRNDTREQINNFPTREQRAGALIDWLMTRGDKTFWMFADSLRNKRRSLYFQLETNIKNEIEEEETKVNEKTMSGDSVRKLIVKRVNDRSLSTQIAAPDSDDGEGRLERDADYVECYVLPMRGKLQREPWLRKKYEPKKKPVTSEISTTSAIDPADADHCNKEIYMAELSEGIVFKKISITVIPPCVKKPPPQCDIYIVDVGKTPEDILEAEKQASRKSFISKMPSTDEVDAAIASKNQPPATVDDATSDAPSEPPPLPPKPDSLPPLAAGAVLKVSAAEAKDNPVKNEQPTSNEIETEEELSIKPPERTTSKQKKPKPPPKPEGLNLQKSSSSEKLDNATSNDQPPIPMRPHKNKPVTNQSEVLDGKSNCTNITNQNADIIEVFENEELVEENNGGTNENVINAQIRMYDQMYETEETTSLNDELPLYGESALGKNNTDVTATAVKSNSADNLINKNINVEMRDKAKWSSFDSGLAGDLSSPLKLMSENQSVGLGRLPDVPTDDALLSRAVRRESVSSDGDSFYEDIDVMGDRHIPVSRPSMDSRQLYLPPLALGREKLVTTTPIARLTSVADLTPNTVVLNKGCLLLADVELAYVVNTEQEKDNSAVLSKSSGNFSGAEYGDNPDQIVWFIGTVLAIDNIGRAFYVPRNALKLYGDPSGEVWFYPLPISSKQAAIFLGEINMEGCFLVYKPSISINPAILYNLSISLGSGDVVHYHIVENIHGDLLIEGDDHSFLTIKNLVHYYRCNKGHIATRLRRPLREANLAIESGYHYEAKWEIDRASLKLSGNMIGQGAYGYTCSGVYGRTPVSVKVLQQSNNLPAIEDEFIEEAKILMSLNHEHIVNFVGISCKFRPFYLVCELVSRSNLRDSLKSMTRTLDSLFDFCLQITNATLYLEEQHYVIHRNLAAHNFFLGDDGCIKLGEFSSARRVNDDNYQASRSEKLSVKWAAPEVLMHSSYSTKSDVWALGIVFWEVFSYGERPYSTLTCDQTAIYIVEGKRLERPKGCPQDIYSLMKSCWQESPDDRPSFAQIHNNLKSKSSIYYFGPIKYRAPIAQSYSLTLDSRGSSSGKVKQTSSRRTVAESVPEYEMKSPAVGVPGDRSSATDSYYEQ